MVMQICYFIVINIKCFIFQIGKLFEELETQVCDERDKLAKEVSLQKSDYV